MVKNGFQLFIVGANGSGNQHDKRFVSENNGKKVWISAHRQTWFNSGSIDFTPESRQRYETNTLALNLQYEARWKEYNPGQSLSAILFDLVAKENTFQDNQNLARAQDISAESLRRSIR